MTARRKLTALSVFPVVLAVGGVASAAPGQPGLAVPGEGQPGLTQPPQAPVAPSAPSPADWIPDPPAPPARPRPQQQTQPHIDTWVQPPSQRESEPEAVEPPTVDAPAVIPADPHQLRLGTGVVNLPDFVDVKTRDKAQAYADYAEWQIAATYDSFGFSREDSDRMAATSSLGALLGAGTAGALAPAAFVPVGCGIGAVAGAVAGGLIGGIPTAGVGAVPGAIVGGIAGCIGGGSIGGLASVPLVVGGGALAALAGGALSGGDATKPQPPAPSLVDQPIATPVSAPAPAPLIDIPGILTVAAPVPVAATESAPTPRPLIDIPGILTVAAPVQVAAPAPAPEVADPVRVAAPEAAAPEAAATPVALAPTFPAAAPDYAQPIAQVTNQVSTTVEDIADSSPVGEAVVTTLRDAVATMPALGPELGPAADLVNGVVAAIQAPH